MAKNGTHALRRKPVAVLAVFALTGFLFVAASVSAGGDDLRPAGGDVGSLLRERSERIDARRAYASGLREQIDELSAGVGGDDLDELRARVRTLEPAMGLTALAGPGMRITLTDAPRTDEPDPDINPNLLVVHQQDIQAYVNALWAGGAEAVSLQGQRLITTTGIKCVGNTVVLDGVPYSPPYVIEAIGDPTRLSRALEDSPETSTYAEYSRLYDLGLDVQRPQRVEIGAYANPIALSHARVTD